MNEAETKLNRDRENFKKAYAALKKALEKAEQSKTTDEFSIYRDSVVKRFEFSLEAAWKYLRLKMQTEDSINLDSPKKVIKEAFSLAYIKHLDAWEIALELRNETVHAYGETYADKAYDFIREYIEIFDFLE